MTGFWLVSYVALWVLFLATAVVLISVLRHIGVLYDSMNTARKRAQERRLTNLVAGTAPPTLTLADFHERPTSLAMFRGTSTAFFVVSPQCGPCHQLLHELAVGTHALERDVQRHVVLSIGDVASTRAVVEEVGLPPHISVLVDSEGELRDAWGVTGTPVTVVVDADFQVLQQTGGLTGQLQTHASKEAVDATTMGANTQLASITEV